MALEDKVRVPCNSLLPDTYVLHIIIMHASLLFYLLCVCGFRISFDVFEF